MSPRWPQSAFTTCDDYDIRRRIGIEVTIRLVLPVVTSRLDYCNSVLAGVPLTTLAPLQRVQNAAARLIVELTPRDHVFYCNYVLSLILCRF